MTALTLMFALAQPAAAAPQCPTPAQMQQFDGFSQQPAGLEDAQNMAMRRLDRSERALQRAQNLVGDDEGLVEARMEVQTLRDGVLGAKDQAGVANTFSSMKNVHGSDCYYTTGEIVAIVLGLVLGVIPGVILLILLC